MSGRLPDWRVTSQQTPDSRQRGLGCSVARLSGLAPRHPVAIVWSQIHDEGTQALENIANIRVSVIAAIEGRAHIHSEYALLAKVIVAAEGATFRDVGHYAASVVP